MRVLKGASVRVLDGDGFGRRWWTRTEARPYQFRSSLVDAHRGMFLQSPIIPLPRHPLATADKLRYPQSMETILYLVRHGETEWNRNGRWQGHADIPLTEDGRQQARALAARLLVENIRVDRVYTSDLSRASETAAIVADVIGREAVALPDLREIDIGGWSGLTRAEIVDRFPGAFQTVFHAPDGETHAAFVRRIVDAVLGLIERHPGEHIMLVTHGGSVRSLLGYVFERQRRPDQSVPLIGNTSITELRLSEDGWRVVRMSDNAHIAGEQQAPDVLSSANEQTAAE